MLKRYCFFFPILFIAFYCFFFSACTKTKPFSVSNVTFSSDSLVFDTVFTTQGSITKQIKIYNPDKKPISLSNIILAGGKNSPFRINVDGISGTSFKDIIIEGKDSLFVFVDVHLNINGKNYPLIIQDSIQVSSNGKNQYLPLIVWGQDAYFHYVETIKESTWKNDKPHIIIGYARIAPTKTLTIEEGSSIHLSSNSLLIVDSSSSILAIGTKDKKITFQGIRLDAAYKNTTGQYYGIYFHKAAPSKLTHTTIRNGVTGIHVYSKASSNNQATLSLENCLIEQNARYGVFLFDNPSLVMKNCIILKNEIYGLFVLQGASFEITHCNILGYNNASKDAAACALKNYYANAKDGVTYVSSIIGTIDNSIVYGYKTNELLYDTISDPSITISTKFNNCLIRLKNTPENSDFSDNIWNTDPNFNSIPKSDYHLQPGSPLIDKGNPLKTLLLDFEDKPRDVNNPDIGAYEFN